MRLRALAAALALAGLCIGPDSPIAEVMYRDVRKVAEAETEEKAVRLAYWSIFESELARRADLQVGGAVGEHFQRDFERDFERFKSRYFQPDAIKRCESASPHTATGTRAVSYQSPRPGCSPSPVRNHGPELAAAERSSSGRVRCRVEARLKIRVIERRLREINRRMGGQWAFILDARPSKDPAADFVVDKLSGAFERVGHRLLVGRRAEQMVRRGEDYYRLAVHEVVSHYEYDEYNARMHGTIRVRFKLTHPSRGRELATVPVVAAKDLRGYGGQTLKEELLDALSQQVSERIASSVLAEVIDYRLEPIAFTAVERDQKVYFLYLEGVSRQNRARVRDVKHFLARRFPDAEPSIDYTWTDDRHVTLHFATGADFKPEDLVDWFYERYDNLHGFEAEYTGGYEFQLSF